MMKRTILLIAAACMAAPFLPAQEKEPSWLVRTGQKAWNSLTAPSKTLDSTYVLQPRLKWTVALEGETVRTGADLHSALTLSDFTGDNAEIVHGTMDTGMQYQPTRKLGVAAGYGFLRFGYGVDLGKKKGDRSSMFSFGLNSSFYGGQIHYYKIRQLPRGTLVVGEDAPIDLSSQYPGELRNLTVEAFYAFNRHRFVYSAAYQGRILQRRSAGSWLVTAKYLQGDFSLDPADPIWHRLNDLQRYSTQQVSIGGGYSYNWVLYHRDPADPQTAAGLRNLTFNATLLPMLSFLNHIQTEQDTEEGSVQVRYRGQPAFAPTVRGAVNCSFGRVNLNLIAGYNRFGFQGVETEVSQEGGHLRTKVKTQGVFYDLQVQAKVNVRF